MFLFVLQFLAILHSNHVVVSTDDEAANTDDYGPRIGYACEGSTLKIECAPGLLIRIMRANYGRFNMAICNDGRQTDGWNLECMSSRSLRIVSEMCDREPWCIVPASNAHFGDTCSTTFKYLEIEYNCARDKPTAVDTPQTIVSNEINSSAALRTSSSLETKTSHVSASSRTATTSAATHGMAPLSSSSPHPPSPDPSTPAALFCEATFNRNVHWPRSKPGETVVTECPNNPAVQKAIWTCGKSPVVWMHHPDLSGCVSPQVVSIQNLLSESHEHFNPGIIEIIASDLVQLTEPEEDVFGGDLSTVTAAMQEAVDQVDIHVHEVPPDKAVQLVHKVNQAVLQTSSNLLDEKHFDSWKDLPQAEQAQTATRMMSTIENSAFQVARTLTKPTIVINVTVNIVVEVRIVNVNEPVEDLVFPSFGSMQFDGTEWADCDNSITLTGHTVQQLGIDGLAKVVFATYNNMDQWLNSDDYSDDLESNDDPETVPELKVRHGAPMQMDQPDVFDAEDEEYSDNEILKQDDVKSPVISKIISASVNGRRGEQIPLEEPIIYTLEHITDAEIYNPSCSFWEYSEKTMDGKWSTVGCDLVHTNTTHTTCQCTHLTNFAVLMSVKAPLATLSHQQKFTLSFITYFGCILSIVCLILCFITFVCFKNLWCDRNTIHANLVACLCIAEIVFLFGIIQYDKPLLCSAIAGVLHYLFLVTFAWMCMEGIQLYVLLVEVFEVEKPRIKWYYLTAYAIPAVIVGISAIVYHEGYGTTEHCWLSTEKGFIWAFVGPVCVILFVNFVMLTVAIVVMCRHASSSINKWKMNQKTQFENVRSWVKTAMILVVLLGLTWTFGLFYVNEQTVIMAYVFAILNSLQGVFIFILHCIMNDKVMKEYKRWVRHTSWIPESLVRCGGGTRPSISTSPINSSSSGKLMKEQKISLEHLTKLLAGRQRKRSSTTSLPSSSNQIKRGYNRMQRNSSGRDSSHLTDSGIACNDDFSHIYSEPTEDPNAYLEPVRLHLDPRDEYYMTGGDISMIEGSVADTDYLEDYGRRNKPVAINVDKYKIMPMTCYNNRLSTMSEDNKPTSESSDYSDTDGYTLTSDPKKTTCQYEQELLSMPLTATDATQKHGSDDSLVRKKLMALNDDMPDVLLFNNLNKSTEVISMGVKQIAEPNIEGSSSDGCSTSSRGNQSVVGGGQETGIKSSSDLLMQDREGPTTDQTTNSTEAAVRQMNNIDKTNNGGNSRVSKR